MTKERRTTILILTGTLLLGILLGLLVPGFFHKYGGRDYRRGDPGQHEISKQDWFAHTIVRIIKPDSTQAPKIRPITEWASKEIEAVEQTSNQRMSDILDSVKIQLAPILSTEQQQRLDEFQGRAQRRWKGTGDRR